MSALNLSDGGLLDKLRELAHENATVRHAMVRFDAGHMNLNAVVAIVISSLHNQNAALMNQILDRPQQIPPIIVPAQFPRTGA